ncbi:bifunctional phosphoglucose/phosphomannose isomerase [Candidatus Woesearchaeota archaeon]|nr:bifunctional phosphoglucose/phosphomannose isomerase [Candidatus Woesearchaeota archaeon]RLE43666.1 MAG: bifunctional phosphoglucose/phosphomannose isomerase [Candidatus Woesearchaeota archaeon]
MSFEETKEQLLEFPNFIKKGWESAKDISVLDKVSSVVICGMGGSAIPGDILAAYLNLDIPIYTVRDYTLPSFIDKHALVFAISYSGNTEETLSCFRSALGLGCKIIGITSGGKLKQLCEKHKAPCIIVPQGIQPRHALPLLFFPMLRVLSNSKLIEDQSDYIEKSFEVLSRDVYSEMGKALAEKLQGKIVIVYSSDRYKAVAYRWKTQINENAKSMAFAHVFPELNHNEVVGFEHLIGDYYVVMLQDETEHPRIKKRMKITKQLISEHGVSSTVIVIKGSNQLSKIFSAIYIGDWTSLHLAGLYQVDPTPVEIVEKLKKML